MCVAGKQLLICMQVTSSKIGAWAHVLHDLIAHCTLMRTSMHGYATPPPESSAASNDKCTRPHRANRAQRAVRPVPTALPAGVLMLPWMVPPSKCAAHMQCSTMPDHKTATIGERRDDTNQWFVALPSAVVRYSMRSPGVSCLSPCLCTPTTSTQTDEACTLKIDR